VDGHIREIKEIEIGQLHLRYAHTRIERLKESLALAASIERIGQIVPVIVVREELILLDGYLRVKALKRLGRDTVMAEIRECKEEDALVAILSQGRRWDLLEEAALLVELHDQRNLSQEKIASMVGRTQGWVSTRLALYRALSQDLIELIRKGSISTWTATRVIVPIARAMPEHGKALSENLKGVSFSTREMTEFFRHYRKAGRTQRENMVHEPALFLKSLCAKEEAAEAKVLKEGLEGKYLRDLRVITHMLKGLLKEVPLLFSRGISNLDRRILLTAFEDSRQQFVILEQTIRRYNDYRGDKTGHCKSVPAGGSDPADRQDPQDIPEHGEERDQREGADAKRVPL
jgi:ParB family chromosome partitioning protein